MKRTGIYAIRVICKAMVSLLVLNATSVYAAQPPVVLQAKKTSNSAITLKISIKDSKLLKGQLLKLERSGPTKSFSPAAEFTKLKKSTSFKDTRLASGKYTYRVRIQINARSQSRWYKSNQIALTNKPTPTSTPSAAKPTATPTPAPTSGSANFDRAGNVTPAGKVLFGIPSNMNANITAGAAIIKAECTGCHSPKYSRTYPIIRYVVPRPPMNLTTLTDQQFADITAYLNQYR